MTGASVALRVLVEARQDGLSDEEILARSPVVLALTPPRVAPAPELPAEADADRPRPATGDSGNDNGILREALRLRVRWIQELSGRAAWELGERLAPPGDLTEPELIRHMTPRPRRGGRHQAGRGRARAGRAPTTTTSATPLPAWFQLSDLGKPIRAQCAERGRRRHRRRRRRGHRRGHLRRRATRPTGSVLVTTTLTPGLAPLLPRLEGIVAETGSVLSHLAILAREARRRHRRRLRRRHGRPARGRRSSRRRRHRPGHHRAGGGRTP